MRQLLPYSSFYCARIVTIWQFFVDPGAGPPQEIGIEHGQGPAGQSAGDQGAAGP
ncbi:hypothetical protein [Streptomyces sp. NPDC048845]|uniref:hypothetical protein n=1 Tax=Streptomyces sp. NPDC048845 TaxID=3155390 RepID=UPI003436194D